ncbi:MAG: hypothetical protein GXO55_11220 [Chloroflexi bacterium]|nr:hypothetical protein [Chloroflexota bacterium]
MAVIRDIAIIALAVESVIVGILVIILAWQTYRLVRAIHNELEPLVRDMEETAQIVRGTAEYVSRSVVTPTVKVSKTFAAVRRAAKAAKEFRSKKEG